MSLDRYASFFFFTDTATTEIYTLSLHDALPIVRNLTAGEIVGQVLALMRELGPQCGEFLFLVFMGMGEPLHNLGHVHRAIRVLCHPAGMLLSPRRITVSTAGLVSGIERLARME